MPLRSYGSIGVFRLHAPKTGARSAQHDSEIAAHLLDALRQLASGRHSHEVVAVAAGRSWRIRRDGQRAGVWIDAIGDRSVVA